MNRPLSLTRHIHKLRLIGVQIVAEVISNEMPSTQHHEYCLKVLCFLWNTMKSCVLLCHHLKQEHCNYRKYVVLLYNGTYEMASV